MAFEVEGWTMMFYDKFAHDHTFSNPHTIGVRLEDLFTSDCAQLTGSDAIAQFNADNNTGYIPLDLNTQLYQPIMFLTTYNNRPGNIAKYTVIGVNNKQLETYIQNAQPIPHEKLLALLCKYHMAYKRAAKQESILSTLDSAACADKIIKKVTTTLGDITDQMIGEPDFLNCQLYDYQKRSIHWMLQRERDEKQLVFSLHDEVMIGRVFFDAMKQNFNFGKDRKQLTFYGGALIDEVGLGKTIQTVTLSLLNPSTNFNYIKPGINRLLSRATLILCPNQLCGQWKREIEKMVKCNGPKPVKIISMLTKVHHDKYTYQDLLDADFVVLSYSFLDNDSYLSKWMGEISSNKSYHKGTPAQFNLASVKAVFEKLASEIIKNPSSILDTNPLFPVIKFHRVIVDEFHEIYTVPKYSFVVNQIPLLDSRYRWCVTGTPFDKNEKCLVRMVDFVTNFSNTFGDNILGIETVSEHLKTNFFRKNTKKSIEEEYKLPPIKETVVRLRFTQTERMMYNAYLANPNNDKFSVFLRQLCCHPKLAEETKDLLANCKTLDDIEKMMVLHYEKGMNDAKKIVTYYNNRIKILNNRIKRVERKRQRRFLNQIGYYAEINKEDLKFELEPVDIDIENQEPEPAPESDDDDDAQPPANAANKPKIQVADANQEQIIQLVGHLLKANKSKTIEHINDNIRQVITKLNEAQTVLDGKTTTYSFYKNVFDRIKKTTDKPDKPEDEESNEESDEENEEEQCSICLGDIPENDVGVTKCGHVYCYECIKTVIAQTAKCPYCSKHVKSNELFMISYEKKKAAPTKEIKDKLALINEIGTKITNIIYYLKSTKEHVIIFSQWDDLLRKIGGYLNDYGIKNVYCRGNVYQRDKAIRLFNSDEDMRVIMLSSESAASGTNLTKASKVIIIDPVCGTYEYRKNTEGQAIGRAHRMGQKNQVEVLRFIINDTIEQEIYDTNKKEDSKHIQNLKIFETKDEDIVLTQDKIDELNESINASTKTKELKKSAPKKVVVRGKKAKVVQAQPVEEEEED